MAKHAEEKDGYTRGKWEERNEISQRSSRKWGRKSIGNNERILDTERIDTRVWRATTGKRMIWRKMVE